MKGSKRGDDAVEEAFEEPVIKISTNNLKNLLCDS